MSDLSAEQSAARRIAAARSARTAVDNHGHPTGKPSTYSYDEAGRLVETKPGTTEETEPE